MPSSDRNAPGRPRLSPGRIRVLSEIVDALLPDAPALDTAPRSEVHADVTAFVTRQVEAMPAFLAWAYRLAITAFDALAGLRHGRRFVSLEPARQRAYLELWSHSPIGPMRDFVKLIRSCSLLAFFDHPQVHARFAAGDPGAAA